MYNALSDEPKHFKNCNNMWISVVTVLILLLHCSLGKEATQTKKRKDWRAEQIALEAAVQSQLNRYIRLCVCVFVHMHTFL